MSFFPRSFYGSDASFTPLFRLLDDFDNYSREGQGAAHGSRQQRARMFSPKFDVRETDASYELHGELPGLDRSNVNIEFTEPQTIVINGRVERSYSAGTPPAGFVEEAEKPAIEAGGEKAGAPEGGKSPAAAEANGGSSKQRATDKYWVSERSVGEFSRTFSFPTPVDQDAVSAGLENGILSVTIPKAKKKEGRRIAVN